MKLVDFLTKVVSNPGWQRRFCEDPEATIDQANLSTAELEAINSGDADQVARQICLDTSRHQPVD